MAKKIKRNPDPHVVYMDTSTLWHDDKRFPVDPKVDLFFSDYQSDFSLSLMLPEVVKGEIIFQQCNNAFKNLRKANEAIVMVSNVTGKTYRHRVSERRVKNEIHKKFDQWIRSRKATLLQTPSNDIDWTSLIHSSIWREPPFSNDKEEKGFRDSVILETIVNHVKNYDKKEQLVFLCKDRLLRETAENKLADDTRFVAYEYMNDFKSYLDLTRQELEDEFIKSILVRANEKFWKQGNFNGIYYKEDIPRKLRDKYSQYFSAPEESEKSVNKLAGLLMPGEGVDWEPVNIGNNWIYKPQFVRIESDNKFLWETPIYFVRRYNRANPIEVPFNSEIFNERVLVLKFAISWKATVASDGRFLNCELSDIRLTENDFRSPTDEDKSNWLQRI
ncbi:MAG: PIN domain-containing protein [Candidatus Sedimenticola sp. (ex Thyasira tokunagai)]